MISFRKDGFQFNCRAAAVITRPGAATATEVLVTTEPHLPFCYLPGGRIELGEDACTALVLEIREELNTLAEIGPLLAAAETFHPQGDGSQGHNVEFYFSVTLPKARAVYEAAAPFPGCESDINLSFFWQRPDLCDAGVRPLVPLFLRDLLTQPPPSSPLHIVHRET